MSDAAEVQVLTEKAFRRSSLTDGGVEKIESYRIAGILGQIGQPFVSADLEKAIKTLDPKNTGFLDHTAYQTLCKKFVTNPAALIKFSGDEFSFKHLIDLKDFAKP